MTPDKRLTDEQEEKIRKLIQEKRPEQLKMDFALWTRAAVMLLIQRECGVKMIVRTLGKRKRPVLAACILGCSAVMMLGWLMLK